MTDVSVPDYLGRVLSANNRPVGTCFQWTPGVFITAWHVLKDAGAEAAPFTVKLDRLNMDSRISDAKVLRVDPRHDIAVLQADSAFPASITGITPTDQIAPQTHVQTIGVGKIDDPGYEYRYLSAAGSWQGPALRDKKIHLGMMDCKGIVHGMSGAPIIRSSDNMVLGVVSGRYNSSGGWGDTVWVARTENLMSLLSAAAPISLREREMFGIDASQPDIGTHSTTSDGGMCLISYETEENHQLATRLSRDLCRRLNMRNRFQLVDSRRGQEALERGFRRTLPHVHALLVLFEPDVHPSATDQSRQARVAKRPELALAIESGVPVIAVQAGNRVGPLNANPLDDFPEIPNHRPLLIRQDKWEEDVSRLAAKLRSVSGTNRPSRRAVMAIGTTLLGATIGVAASRGLSNSHRPNTSLPPVNPDKTGTAAPQMVTTGLNLDRRPAVVSAGDVLNVLINDEVGGIRAIRSRDAVKWDHLKLITHDFLCRNPSITNFGDSLHLVAAGLDGSIRWLTADASGWRAASTIAPSGTADSEARIVVHRNLLWGFAGAGDAMLASTSDGEDWSDWKQIGRVTNLAGQLTPTIFNGSLYLFARDTDGRLWGTTYDGRAWGEVALVQGLPIAREHTVISSDRGLALFVRDSGGRIWHGEYFDGRVSGRARISEIPTAIRGPVVAEFNDRRVLFTADRSAGVQVSFEQERGWEIPRRIGGILLAGAPVVSSFHDSLVVLVIDEAGTTWSSTYLDGRWLPFVHVA